MCAVEALLRTGRALLTEHAPGAPQKFGFHYPPFNRCGRLRRRRRPAPAPRTVLAGQLAAPAAPHAEKETDTNKKVL